MNDEDKKRFNSIVDTFQSGTRLNADEIKFLVVLCRDQAISLDRFYIAAKKINDYADVLIQELGKLVP